MKNFVKVPENFMDMSVIKYPPHQSSKNIEGKFYNYVLNNRNRLDSKLTYLPIQWTNHLVKNGYGKNTSELQEYIYSLPKDQKYFSIIQYAGGPLINIDNILFFSSGGMFNTKFNSNLSYISIPLISDIHKVKFFNKKKKYLASYIGRITHTMRETIENEYGSSDNFYIKNLKTMQISYYDRIKFKNVMKNSLFSICPRGYGPTSFRLYESIQLGSVPIYIAENGEHLLPYSDKIDWDKLGIIINQNQIKDLEKILLNLLENNLYLDKLNYGRECQKKYFNFEFITKNILEIVNCI